MTSTHGQDPQIPIGRVGWLRGESSLGNQTRFDTSDRSTRRNVAIIRRVSAHPP